MVIRLPLFFNGYPSLGYTYWRDKKASCKDTLACLFCIFISRCISGNIISINLLLLIYLLISTYKYHLIYKNKFCTENVMYKTDTWLKIHINQDFDLLDKFRSWNKNLFIPKSWFNFDTVIYNYILIMQDSKYSIIY